MAASSKTGSSKTVLRSSEFTCPSCVSKIESRLSSVPGVASARVHFATGRIEVAHDSDVVSVSELVEAVADAGYRASPSAF